ncbi:MULTISPECIES: hypothetical protein [Sporosarcina]|uniref:hypothetical protein n=1 Tax=Sporosarcina TaxID=1569 RepID=UPI00058F8527|nr:MULTISPECIES: hypothetical protein [Sporosarcina]WJY26199.1 hypothetical protein QWT68_08880 [Sporosarcina sp. 0.2-SM1T-5]
MKFIDYLKTRHELKPGVRPLSDVSAEQYDNRLHNLKRHGIYSEEREITDGMLEQIDRIYKNGQNHYPRAMAYYIEFLNYLDDHKNEPSPN